MEALLNAVIDPAARENFLPGQLNWHFTLISYQLLLLNSPFQKSSHDHLTIDNCPMTTDN
jgi:hypothetical protein